MANLERNQEPSPESVDFADWQDAPVLADRVRSRLLLLQSPEHRVLQHSRRLKSGVFRKQPLEILAYHRLQKGREDYLHPDHLAHSLSLCAADLPARCFANLKQIVLIPELVQNNQYLLTHLFFPAEGMLAFYLYPRRLNMPGAGQSLRLQSSNSTVHRLQEFMPARIARAGLLEQVLRTLGDLPAQAGLQKFLLPHSEVQAAELLSLQACAERYNLLAGA